MKRTIIIAAVLSSAFGLAFCKSSKKSTAAAAPSPAMSEEAKLNRQMQVAQARWPGVAALELQEGNRIYTTKCTRCHGNFEITRFTETKWLHEIDEMAPKAKLTEQEKDQLTKHILSYREAFASPAAK